MEYDELLRDVEKRKATTDISVFSWSDDDLFNELAAAIRSLQSKLDAVRPRPLSECDWKGALVTRLNDMDEPSYYIVFRYPNGKWLSGAMSDPWSENQIGIPLSALTSLEDDNADN